METTMTWNDVVGLTQLTDNLQNAIKHNKISHAYLIQGEKLSGKRMIADIFARALQCEAGKHHQSIKRHCLRCRLRQLGRVPATNAGLVSRLSMATILILSM